MDTNDLLSELLGSKTRARILSLLLVEPAPRLHLREIVRRSGLGVSSVQRELERLVRLGIVRSEREGSNRFFIAARHPLEPELRALVAKAATRSAQGSGERAVADDVLVRLNPAVREKVPAIIDAGRRHRVSDIALFGSATQPEASVAPRDLDVLVTFEQMPSGMRADAYFELLDELQEIMGMPVDIVVTGAIRNPYFKAEVEATRVVLYEAA